MGQALPEALGSLARSCSTGRMAIGEVNLWEQCDGLKVALFRPFMGMEKSDGGIVVLFKLSMILKTKEA